MYRRRDVMRWKETRAAKKTRNADAGENNTLRK
jgi:hypothetical protein